MSEEPAEFADGLAVAWDKIGSWVDGFYRLLPNLIVGIVVFAAFVAAACIFKSTLVASFRRRGRDDLGEMLSDFAFWLTSLLGLLLALTVVLPTLNPGDVVAGLGIGSVAIGFAFKDILQNWLAGLLILLRQPFRRGDQISVGSIEGTVQRISQRATLVKTYDGRVVVVPNTDIYTQSITVNTAYDHRRISVDVTVGYDHDVGDVRALITATLAAIDEVRKDPPPQVLPWELGATSLSLKVRFWIDSRRSSEVSARARVVQAIKESFQANGIDPTDPQIIYQHRIDAGSQPAGPHPAAPDRIARPPPPVASHPADPERATSLPDEAHTLLDPGPPLSAR
jgi:small conductance mechanosensitive channel